MPLFTQTQANEAYLDCTITKHVDDTDATKGMYNFSLVYNGLDYAVYEANEAALDMSSTDVEVKNHYIAHLRANVTYKGEVATYTETVVAKV